MGTPSLPWAAWANADCSFSEDIFPDLQPEPPLTQLEAIASRPIAGYWGAEPNPPSLPPPVRELQRAMRSPLSLLFSSLSSPSSLSRSSWDLFSSPSPAWLPCSGHAPAPPCPAWSEGPNPPQHWPWPWLLGQSLKSVHFRKITLGKRMMPAARPCSCPSVWAGLPPHHRTAAAALSLSINLPSQHPLLPAEVWKRGGLGGQR